MDLLKLGVYVYVCVCVCMAHPVEKVLAPSCCPGASMWQMAKCCMISDMSSWLKSVSQQVLSGEAERDPSWAAS